MKLDVFIRASSRTVYKRESRTIDVSEGFASGYKLCGKVLGWADICVMDVALIRTLLM